MNGLELPSIPINPGRPVPTLEQMKEYLDNLSPLLEQLKKEQIQENA